MLPERERCKRKANQEDLVLCELDSIKLFTDLPAPKTATLSPGWNPAKSRHVHAVGQISERRMRSSGCSFANFSETGISDLSANGQRAYSAFTV